MILGVDHLALACEDIRAAAEELSRHGYEIEFVCEGLPNNPVKRPYLRRYMPTHAVAYCRAPRATTIELTQHGTPFDAPGSAYRVTLQARPEGMESAASGGWAAGVWRLFQAPVSVAGGTPGVTKPFIGGVSFVAADARASAEFWRQALGFREQRSGSDDRTHALQFRAPVPTWSLRITIVDGAPSGRPYLDDPGFPCLALLSSDPARDLERCVASGGREPAGPFELIVDGQLLRVALVRGPNDEIVELVGLVKETASSV